MSKKCYVALGGVVAAAMLLISCDRPDQEPGMPKPNLSGQQQTLTYGAPTVQEQTLTYGGPTETRSQEEYVDQMEEAITEDTPGYFTEAKQ